MLLPERRTKICREALPHAPRHTFLKAKGRVFVVGKVFGGWLHVYRKKKQIQTRQDATRRGTIRFQLRGKMVELWDAMTCGQYLLLRQVSYVFYKLHLYKRAIFQQYIQTVPPILPLIQVINPFVELSYIGGVVLIAPSTCKTRTEPNRTPSSQRPRGHLTARQA